MRRRSSVLTFGLAVVAAAGLARAADPEPVASPQAAQRTDNASETQGNVGAFAASAGALAKSLAEPPAAPIVGVPEADRVAPPPERQPSDARIEASVGEAPAAVPVTTPSVTAAAASAPPVATSAPPAGGGDEAGPAAKAEPASPAAAGLPASAVIPAKQLFGAVKTAAPIAARAIGSYSRGCLAGAVALPVDGPQWQAMRLSRNRNWGHPDLVSLVQRLSDESWRYDGWNGLLVGDLAQPRGGPMLTGHASHQLGLDADIWLTPMPDRRLSPKEREDLSATSMIGADEVHINASVWTPAHVKIIKRVASYDKVERVLVHPGIKEALCNAAGEDGDRAWLQKVRPYWGHNYHFHVRIGCPEGSAGCTPQAPTPGDDGCGKELADWLKRVTPKPPEPRQPGVVTPAKPPPPPVTLADMPQECRMVLTTGTPGIPKPLLEKQRQTDIVLAQRAKALADAQAARQAAAAKAGERKAAGPAAPAAAAGPAAQPAAQSVGASVAAPSSAANDDAR